MPEYKLIYFNARGRAELIRWICAYAEIPYTDERIEIADWPERKATIPGGKVPVLMVDDEPLLQSLAISRYLAKEGGLVPEDNLEAAHCDAIADTLSEMMSEVYKVMFASGDKEEQEKKFKEEVYPNVVTPVLKSLEERLDDREFLVSDAITWVDIMSCLIFCAMTIKNPEVLEGFPKVEAHLNNVYSDPKIKAWNESQPELPF